MRKIVMTNSQVSHHFLGFTTKITSDIWEYDLDYNKLFPKFIPHIGLDYRAPMNTKVIAGFTGWIVAVRKDLGSTYGRQIFLTNVSHTIHYAHLSHVSVNVGDTVKKGEMLGLTGASGTSEMAYSPHLHLGVANGIIKNASAKGNYLGDIWIDVESFNFDKQKTNAEIAKEVIDGKWGNNPQRKNDLINAGYDYGAIQDLINQKYSDVKLKTNAEIAKEVIDGKWGNNPQRKNDLIKAGYDYDSVQKAVNEHFKERDLNVIAKEVIDGKWGNNPERKKKLIKEGYDYKAIQKIVNHMVK